MVAERFACHGCIKYAEPGAPMALGHGEAGDALRNKVRPELLVMAGAGAGDGAAAPHRQAIGQEAPERSLEHLLLLRERAIVAAWLPGAAGALGSRGSPSPRSPMMFFWMLVEPPPIMRPMSYILSMCHAVASSVSAASSLAS